jgi:type IV pilus assembly protein PilV
MHPRPPNFRHDPRRRAQRGVALIEALVAVLIFAFGVLGLIGLEAQAINFSIDTEDRNRAALFASDIASSMWLNGSVVVSTAQYNIWQAALANSTGQCLTPAPPNCVVSSAGVPGGQLSFVPAAGTANTTGIVDIKITWVAQSETAANTQQLTTRVIMPVLP